MEPQACSSPSDQAKFPRTRGRWVCDNPLARQLNRAEQGRSAHSCSPASRDTDIFILRSIFEQVGVCRALSSRTLFARSASTYAQPLSIFFDHEPMLTKQDGKPDLSRHNHVVRRCCRAPRVHHSGFCWRLTWRSVGAGFSPIIIDGDPNTQHTGIFSWRTLGARRERDWSGAEGNPRRDRG